MNKVAKVPNIHELAWRVRNNEEFDAFIDEFVAIHQRFACDKEEEIRFIQRLELESKPMSEHIFEGRLGPGAIQRLESSPLLKGYASLIVDGAGYILEASEKAVQEYQLDLSKSLEENGIESYEYSGIPSQLRTLSDNKKFFGEFDLVQVFVNQEKLPSTLAVLPFKSSGKAENDYLLVFLNSTNLSKISKRISEIFRLTKSETEVASAVLAGHSLREVADLRQKSYKTVRNQFQQILEKTNTNSQAMFLRLVSDFAFLVREKSNLSVPLDHNSYQVFEMPRPHGRKIDVILAGDFTGTPVVTLSEILGHLISKEFVDHLKQQNLYLVSISLPGFGKTSPPSSNMDMSACIASDVTAVLDALEIQKCAVVGRLSGARDLFNLLLEIPERFSDGFVVGGALPRSFQKNPSLTSKWTQALVSVTLASRSVLKVIMVTTHRILMTTENPKKHFEYYFRSKSDKQFLNEPGIGEFMRTSMRKASAIYNGDLHVRVVADALQPWGNEASNLRVPVTLIHGEEDNNLPITEARAFAHTFPEVLNVHEIKGAGSLAYLSHFGEVFSVISTKVRKHANKSKLLESSR